MHPVVYGRRRSIEDPNGHDYAILYGMQYGCRHHEISSVSIFCTRSTEWIAIGIATRD